MHFHGSLTIHTILKPICITQNRKAKIKTHHQNLLTTYLAENTEHSLYSYVKLAKTFFYLFLYDTSRGARGILFTAATSTLTISDFLVLANKQSYSFRTTIAKKLSLSSLRCKRSISERLILRLRLHHLLSRAQMATLVMISISRFIWPSRFTLTILSAKTTSLSPGGELHQDLVICVHK